MKKMNTVKRIAALTIAATMIFAGAAMAQASEKAMGTKDTADEFKAEALIEKAMETKAVTNNEAIEENEVITEVESLEEIIANIEVVTVTKAQEAKAEAKVEAKEEAEAVEEIAEVETAAEFVEEDELEMVAEIANTADGAAANNEVMTIDAATAATSADGVVVEFGNTKAETTTVKTTTTKTVATTAVATKNTLKDVNAKYIGTPTGTKRAITLIGDSTFRDITKLQAAIDANNIICYPTADMTKGVKYMAGHNPGAMSHIAGLKVGSIVRLSNDEGHQDYQIKEIKTGIGSFASVTFNTSNGVKDAWTMVRTGAENAVIIQYCVNGVNTLHYGVAL